MIRQAKIFLLNGSSWELIKERIEFSNDYEFLESNIAIYDLLASKPNESYAILSTHSDVDKMIIEFGVTENNDTFKESIKQRRYPLLFGDDLIDFL